MILIKTGQRHSRTFYCISIGYLTHKIVPIFLELLPGPATIIHIPHIRAQQSGPGDMIAGQCPKMAENVSTNFFDTAEFQLYLANYLNITLFYPIFDFIGSKLAMKHGVDVPHPL